MERARNDIMQKPNKEKLTVTKALDIAQLRPQRLRQDKNKDCEVLVFLGRVDMHLLEYLPAEIYDFKDKSKFGKLLSKDTGALLLAAERIIMRQ
ncbi:hypothetical protein ACHAQE_000616 [Botrytis cinerea]